LTSAPATESIMGAISRAKAGVGSAVNDSTRLIGGTPRVAVIGSVYLSVYGTRPTRTTPAPNPGPILSLAHPSHAAPDAAAVPRRGPDRAPGPPGPRAGAAARLHQRVPARPHYRFSRRRGRGRGRGRAGRPVPARPAREPVGRRGGAARRSARS